MPSTASWCVILSKEGDPTENLSILFSDPLSLLRGMVYSQNQKDAQDLSHYSSRSMRFVVLPFAADIPEENIVFDSFRMVRDGSFNGIRRRTAIQFLRQFRAIES